jgi:hypothetical protein
MIIVRLLSTRAFWLVATTKVYSGTGAGVVMESIVWETVGMATRKLVQQEI